ncbi:MAG: efflux RND transporter periplasmic adaptor subunit [Planctomycetes bacterium]|nr:efflux RND transporter periplasmic adaptor subunit [Planctomycetota bacterium]
MHMRSEIGRIAVGWVLTGLLTLAGCGHQGAGRGMQPGGPPEVAVATVKTQRLVITTELTGLTSPFRVAEVRPQVSGLILKRLFTEGTDVTAGQDLYQIDPAPFQAAFDSAEANLAAAKKNADRARAALEASLAGVTRQRATLELARINRERFEEAFKDKAVSASQRDQAVTEHEVAEAALKAVEAQAESDRTAIAAAEAVVGQAEAALEAARINLGYSTVKAPISGRISRSAVTEGALVTGLQPIPLATIQQLDPIYVDVPQSTAEHLRLQRRLEGKKPANGEARNETRLLLEDGTPYPLTGTLQFREVNVDPTTGSVMLRILFPNPDGLLLPNMFVRAIVEEGVNPQALLVPQQAVSRNPKGEPLALVVDADGNVEQRMLTLDRDRVVGNAWVVSAGLAAGERVIIEGSQKVRPGVPVKAVPFEAVPVEAGKEAGPKAPEGPKATPPAAEAN